MTFFSPAAFFLLISLPLVVLLYILKQKSDEAFVPSVQLWKEAVEDIRASSPWQKLRKNLLMFLQLIVLALVIIALAKPFVHLPGNQSNEMILVLDISAGMQATDVKPSRFESARRDMSEFIKNMMPGTYITILTAGRSTRIVENRCTDRNLLLNRLGEISVTNESINIKELLEILQGLVNQYPQSRIVFYTDSIPKGMGILSDRLQIIKYANSTDNYGIERFAHTLNKDAITSLSTIRNYGENKASFLVSLYADYQLVDVQEIEIGGYSAETIYWKNIPAGTRVLMCKIEQEDIFEADNTAWDAVNPDSTNKVLMVSERNIFLERALSVLPGLELFKTTPEETEGFEGYNLYVFDGCLPGKLPNDGSILVINPPVAHLLDAFSSNNVSGGGGLISEIVIGDEIPVGPVRTRAVPASQTILSGIRRMEFSVGLARKVMLPGWMETVLETDETPLLAIGEKDGRRVALISFDLHSSNLPLKSSFPILMNNLANWLLPMQIENAGRVLPGDTIEFNLFPGVTEAKVLLPDGQRVSIAPPFPPISFNKTESTGVYVLEQLVGDELRKHYFSINIASDFESDLSENNSEGLSGNSDESSGISIDLNAAGRTGTGRNISWLLIIAAFILFLAEWWVWIHGN